MARTVILSPEARADLQALLDYISARSCRATARGYVERIRAFCLRLRDFPERGTRRDDLAEGLRLVGFERRLTIAFHIEPSRVVIDRILSAGRDIEAVFDSG